MTKESGQNVAEMRARLDNASERLERARLRLLRQQTALMRSARERLGADQAVAREAAAYRAARHA